MKKLVIGGIVAAFVFGLGLNLLTLGPEYKVGDCLDDHSGLVKLKVQKIENGEYFFTGFLFLLPFDASVKTREFDKDERFKKVPCIF
jgi:hypothetical protein